MAIASNATEEHQFLFAINTISMVKNDALFSYIAPSNIFAWLLMPLRYCMPLKQFVWLNRTVIKVTHFPVLFCIYLYERLWLAPTMFEPTDLIEHPTRGRERNMSFADPSNRTVVFSPNTREESVAGFHKDRALEEVFRRMPEASTLRTQRRNERHKAQTAIRNWMDQQVEDGEGGSPANWPTMNSHAGPEWQRRLSVGWDRPSNLRQVSEVRSVASDPADLLSNVGGLPSITKRPFRSPAPPLAPDYKEHTDADGDDELVTNDEDDDDHGTNAERSRKDLGDEEAEEEHEDYFTTPMTSRATKLPSSHSSSAGQNAPTTPRPGGPRRTAMHNRTLSTNTILYNPPEDVKPTHSSSSASPGRAGVSSGKQSKGSGEKTPKRRSSPRRKSPQRTHATTKPRPMMPPRGVTETGGVSRSALLSMDPRHRPRGGVRRLSSVDMSILSDNTHNRFADDDVNNGGMAGSFQTQMAMAMMKDDQRRRAAGAVDAADRDRMGRLVLARMKTLEESFSEMIREMRDMKERTSAPPTRRNSVEDLKEGAKGKKSGTTTPRRAGGKARPVSRRSLKETSRVGPSAKGKGLAYSTDDEADGDDSVLKGSSL